MERKFGFQGIPPVKIQAHVMHRFRWPNYDDKTGRDLKHPQCSVYKNAEFFYVDSVMFSVVYKD
jgi:hypothetical protein